MKSDKFKIIVIIKKFVLELDNILVRFPNKEKVLKDRLKSSLYDIIEFIYNANYLSLDINSNERILLQCKILSKLSLIDFFFEEAYKKGYLTESLFHKEINILSDLTTKIKSWMLYEKSNDKRNM